MMSEFSWIVVHQTGVQSQIIPKRVKVQAQDPSILGKAIVNLYESESLFLGHEIEVCVFLKLFGELPICKI